MSHPFRKAFRSLCRESLKCDPVQTDNALDELDAKLEALAIEHFGEVGAHEDDGFGPPASSVQVFCRHCRDHYLSSKIVRAYRPAMQSAMVSMLGTDVDILEPLWWCKNRCDGAGYQLDIVPTGEPRQ